MLENKNKTLGLRYGLVLSVALVSLGAINGSAMAQDDASAEDRPTLVISNSPVPEGLLAKAYTGPVQAREITAAEISGRAYYKPTDTMVSRKLQDLRSELAIMQDKVMILSEALSKLQKTNENKTAEYYAAVATINTQLQTGTTPGNPRLLERFSTAESQLDGMVMSVGEFNNLAVDASKVATEASFLLDSSRATYGLSGAVEEDHIRLARLEDQINATIVMVERLLNTVNDDISRINAYLSTERDNLRTLSLAVSNGSLYGYSLADRPFSGAKNIHKAAVSAQEGTPSAMSAPTAPSPITTRPLVKIKFDGADVDYEQPLYMAVNQAMERYPDVSFKIVGVNPISSSAAETAIESARARRNTQKVARTMSQIGVDPARVEIAYEQTPEIEVNEVQVLIY